MARPAARHARRAARRARRAAHVPLGASEGAPVDDPLLDARAAARLLDVHAGSRRQGAAARARRGDPGHADSRRAAYGYARAVGRSREERGALTLAAAWSNTGFVGIPLTQLAFGHPARALAVVYGRAARALALKFAGGPLALFVAGRALGADVPPAFYLLAAMPCAFHLLVLARVYDVRPALMRLLVVGSNAIAVVAVSVGAALAR